MEDSLAANRNSAGRPSESTSTMKAPLPSLWWTPLLIIGASAFAVEIPFFFKGMPSGHDVEFHLYSWLEVLSQWKIGIWYPRWAAMAHFGYGEPRFIFYPPASWTLGALLSAIFPWTLAASVYLWLVLTANGASMFLLARRWFNRRDAIFVAALYAVNPYHLVIVYWRSAFAELLAGCLLPLLLLCLLKAAEDNNGWRMTIPLGAVMAGAWLTNAPAAVMIHYSLGLLILLLAWRQRSPRLLAVGATAMILGACLAAFYLLPAIYEQKWVTIAEAVSAGSRPLDNFLFVHTSDVDHDRFNRIVSWLAVAEMAAILAAAWAAKQWSNRENSATNSSIAANPARNNLSRIWSGLAIWAVACSILMFPVTGLLWNTLPKLRFMQFPWRWMLCLSMIFCLLLTAGVRRWWLRIAVVAAMLLVIAYSWQRIQTPWWDNAGDLHEMQDNIDDAGYEGTDEYTPAGAEPSVVDKDARRVTVDGPEHAAIRVLQWNARSKVFAAELSAPSHLALHLFNYPAWQVMVNGHVVEATMRAGTGQMLVPVQQGINRVQITFIRTGDRTAGAWISALTFIVTLLIRLFPRQPIRQRAA